MSGLYLLQLGAQKADWLATRQAVVARNIANANTPGFKAQEVKPFADVLNHASLGLAATSPLHLGDESGSVRAAGRKTSEPWAVTASGNSVSLEKELIAAGEVNRGFGLNAGIAKAFHRMLLAGVKS